MDAESRQLVDCMEKKGVYDALQRKDLKAVLSCIVETVVDAASLRYCGSETQHVMRNITPHHIRNLAWKMVGTLGQLKRIDLDKMSSDSDSQIIPTKENQYNAKDENDEGLSVNDDVKRPVKEAMDDAGLQKSQMDEFVLAGGSTRIPKIQQLLKDFFEGKERSKGVNPEEKEKIKASTKEALDWLDEKLKEVEAADNSLHSGSFGEEGDTSDDDDDDDDIKRDGISKKGTYYQCEKQASSSRGKEDASNDQLDSSSSRDSEYDNMEDEEGRMFAPKRRGVLGRCPELGKEGRNYVSRKLARRCLGNTRYGLLKESNPNRSKLGFSDSGGAMLLFWEPPSLPRKYVSRNRTRENMEIVAGYVRDQLEHLLCWAYASADLISASLVLHGWEKEYKPLCARYLNDKVAPQRLGQDLQGADLDDSNIHTCYGYNAKRALLYVQQHGIPEEKEVTFNCNHTRPEYPNEKMHGITDVFRYHTLEQALVRLKSHPVVANLLVYTGWDQNGIYRGPKTSGAQREGNGDHQVLMLDCREINGERVIHCKSSNGRDHTFCGYIDVSLEVMVMYICKEGDDEDDDLCSLRPQYLLSDFFSVGMETGPFGLQFKLKPNREKRNLKFRYIQNEGENESYQFLKRIGSGSLVPTGRCIRVSIPHENIMQICLGYNYSIVLVDSSRAFGLVLYC